MFNIVQGSDGMYISKYSENSTYSFPVYPSKTKPPSELTKIVSVCLLDRLREEGGVKARCVLGQCHTNSIALFNKLQENGYEPQLCLGANTEAGSESNLRDAFENVKNVHQWVVTDGYTLEICSEDTNSFGHMYISKETPNNYNCYYKLNPEEFDSLNVSEIRAKNINTVLEKLK